MLRKAKKDIGIFTQVGIALPVGISAIGAAGGESGALTGISQQMPLIGEIKGKGMLLGVMREVIPLYPEKTKKRSII